jgi:3-oxoacyl-[acyl-carrier protein] reductase
VTDTVLITGASRGIGFSTAKMLAKRGTRVIGIARTQPSDFPGTFYEADLGTEKSTDACLSKILTEHRIEGVVNNLGLAKGQSIADLSLDDFRSVFDMNARVAAQVVRAVIPSMISRRYGRIVNISSVVALGASNRTSYAAAKGALISMTRAWALEVAEHGITVNAVAPGPTKTELFRSLNPPGSPGELRYLTQLPVKRLGEPHEIAAAIGFLLERDSGFITGQVLYVDGGLSAGHAPA